MPRFSRDSPRRSGNPSFEIASSSGSSLLSNSSERPRLMKASSLRTELGIATAAAEKGEEWMRRVLRREMGEEKKGLSKE